MAEDKYLNGDGLAHVLRRFKETYISLHAVSYKEMVDTISSLPSFEVVKVGYMYGIRHGGETTEDFVGGAGQTIYDGDNVICVNVGTDEEPELKWDAVGGMVNISDRLQFGNSFPASPVIGDTFLYMGPNTYSYDEADPEGTENPAELGWYEYSIASSSYVLTEDDHVVEGKDYYIRQEQYKKGIVYVYSIGDIWAPQPNGDTISSIDLQDIDNLFR